MQSGILEAFPGVDITALIAWVPMLPEDSAAAAAGSANLISDRRAQHFYDGSRVAGSAVAQSLGAAGQVAWDTYVFYQRGVRWGDAPPSPAAWVHQLGTQSWADPTRYRSGEELVRALRHATSQMIQELQ